MYSYIVRKCPFTLKFYFHRGIKTEKTRVRFAPSPTGYLHLGGLRTAFYNFLFAKSRGGDFILRIEDTDQSRKVEGAIEALKKDLDWAGIESNEGPGIKGNSGPYVQSDRLNIYQKQINKLLDNGSAYRCFCSERRLNVLRRDAARAHTVPKYDNCCRHLSEQDIMEKMSADIPFCIRFRLTSDCSSFEDLIFGGVAYDVSQNEGDPVLMKTDGYPTYHFANVVDDHLMGITHVLRGVEWQISTTKHLLIYRAFGWKPPQFGHLPLIVNSDGTKLSKRQSDIRVEDYRNNGIFPLSLVNYITLSGGGFDHVSGAGIRLKSLEELTQEFKIEKISSHPSRLNADLLEECNRLEIKRRLKDVNLTTELVAKTQDLIKEKYVNKNFNNSVEHVRNILEWSTSRITRIEQLVSSKFGFLWILPENKNLDLNKSLLKTLIKELEALESFEENKLNVLLREFSKNNDVKYPLLMKCLRSTLSGLNEGPGVSEMMGLLGKEQSLKRIKAVI